VSETHRFQARAPKRIAIHGVEFDPVQEDEVVHRVIHELSAGRGGQIVTPNVDILRRVDRDAEARHHLAAADIVVADGKPLIWASRIGGTPLPARIAGSDLIWSLTGALAERGRSIYLLGGEPGTARRADQVMRARFPDLTVAGHLSPPFGFDARPEQFDGMCDEVVAAQPDLVYVGLGFPKQERVIARLRPLLPRAWFLGCGAAIGFVAGVQRRAPLWMQRSGTEWLHRLMSEPHRLARRYLVHDVPFALRLLATASRSRLGRVRSVPPPAAAAGTAAATSTDGGQ
jgi:N-acetylglucosaminyldiphosphoundecaprenol N-acetyl-beta-D-mannosaminyltransferase